MFSDDFVTIHHGDAWELAAGLEPQSVHTIVTSPPYWGLRDYGDPGQFGLEPTPEEYVAKLVDLFARLRPALRDDGTVWLNLGDCYATGAGAVGNCPGGGKQGERWTGNRGAHTADNSGKQSYRIMGPMTQLNRMPIEGLKPKDLVGIPWRVAFALQADGWYLRSDIIWHKPNPMPESVTDRPTKAHEYVFLLSKKARYYYDAEAIKEDAVKTEVWQFTDGGKDKQRGHSRRHEGFNGRYAERLAEEGAPEKRNKRSVWTVATKPFSQAHFAVFPPDLIKPCILAGCPEGGTVLDPFMGSGTTAQVARSLGRKAVGFELNADYIEIAAKHRLAQGVLL